MLSITGAKVLKAEWKEFGEGDKKRRVFFGVAGDTDIYCQYQVSGEAPADIAVGDVISFRATKEPECSNPRWGIKYEGVITREKAK